MKHQKGWGVGVLYPKLEHVHFGRDPQFFRRVALTALSLPSFDQMRTVLGGWYSVWPLTDLQLFGFRGWGLGVLRI